MDQTRQYTGKRGENIAKKFLEARGMYILDKNLSTPFGEIDIIARDKKCLIFVEVKTRISTAFGPPLLSITKKKQKHILNNCRYYMKRHGLDGCRVRIDVIGIKLDHSGKLEVLEHIKNAIVTNGY